MLKATLLEGTIHLTIQPDGPIMIKAGETGSVDPSLPDMQYVRTRRSGGQGYDRKQVYLPGSSLKGVVRAQCERICRSLDGASRYQQARSRAQRVGDQFVPPLADNPLVSEQEYTDYTGTDAERFSSSIYFNRHKTPDSARIYRQSSFITQLFGHTSLAGRVRFADGYLTHPDDVRIEERNGVAIDRVYGSVAHGPFNYEVVVAGTFQTRIDFKNVTLAHLALLGLALRDLGEGRIALGFSKSRGLGRVTLDLRELILRYPTCELDEQGALCLLTGAAVAPAESIAGVGCVAQAAGTYAAYLFPDHDQAAMPAGLAYQPDELLGVVLRAEGNDAVTRIWRACMPCWRQEIGL